MEKLSGIMDMVYELKKKCVQMDQQLMDELNLSQSELLFFSSLDNCQGISSPELARNMGLSPSRISRVVDKLVINGFLDRDIDSTDRRVISLCLTEKGKLIRGTIAKARNACEMSLIDKIPADKVELFREVISKIVKNM